MKKISLLLLIFIVIFAVGGCVLTDKSENDNLNIDENDKKYQIYLLANQSGYNGSYSEWLKSISGDEVELSVVNNNICWKYKSSSQWSKLISLEELIGEKGDKGDAGHTPVLTIEDGFWYIDGVNTNVSVSGAKGDTGNGIASILKTNTLDNVDTYTIYYTDGSTSLFTVTNGAQGIQGIQGEKGNDGHTPIITIQGGYWYIDGVNTNVLATGIKGDTGNGISSIEKTNTNGLIDTYTIYYTNGEFTTFTVTNGAQGVQGIQGEKGNDGHTPIITIQGGYWYIDGVNTNVFATGIKGDTGNGISSIEKTNTNGLIDTYTIYYTDGEFTTFTVTNGAQGVQGIQGEKGNDGHTPVITIQGGYWYIDGVNTNVFATGIKGDTGNGISSIEKTNTNGLIDTYTIYFTNGEKTTFTIQNGSSGLSAYEIYCEKYPSYNKTEEEWLEDLVNGKLSNKQTHTVAFETYCSFVVDSQLIEHGEKVSKPVEPQRAGYEFEGWYTEEGEKWSFVGYVITEDIVLHARYTAKEYKVYFDANGGELSEEYVIVKYGTKPTLPSAIKFKYDCIWTYNGSDINLDEEWKYDEDITLVARWEEQEVIVLRNKDEFLTIRNDLSGKYKLGADIDFDENSILMFGDKENPFTGSLDGDGYAIQNLIIYSLDTYVGLFAVNEGTVKNFGIENVVIDSPTATEYSGFIAGKNYGTISSCMIKSARMTACSTYVGGITGYNEVAAIDGCVISDVDITNTGAQNYVGGLIGYAIDTNITNCTLDVKVKNTSLLSQKDVKTYLGGLVAYCVYNTEDGIIDKNTIRIDISNSLTNESMEALSNTTLYTGGICGYLENANISNVSIFGKIYTAVKRLEYENDGRMDSSHRTYTYYLKDYVSGGIGYSVDSNMYYTYSDVTIKTDDKIRTPYYSFELTRNQDYAKAYLYLGGLIGYSNNDKISNSYSLLKGDYTLDGEGTSSTGNGYRDNYGCAYAYFGGLVGSGNTAITNCFTDISEETINNVTATAFYDSREIVEHKKGNLIAEDRGATLTNSYYVTGFEGNTVLGTAEDFSNCTIKEFIIDKLHWDENKWIIKEISYPTLK